jgi:hypothetical protein
MLKTETITFIAETLKAIRSGLGKAETSSLIAETLRRIDQLGGSLSPEDRGRLPAGLRAFFENKGP